MTLLRGDIYLANLNPQKKPNEIGKLRPVVVVQSNFINENDYPTTIVVPLSTKLIDDVSPLRYRVTKRAKLLYDSDALIAHIRAIDNGRFMEKIASLTSREIEDIRQCIDEVIS